MNKVLIVDDEAIVRFTLRSIIPWEKYGFVVAADCMNGRQALEYAERNTVDLLLTDMKMPDMGGLELMEALRAKNRLPVTVALSGYNEFELVREAFRLGAYDYMLKADLSADSLSLLLDKLNEKIFGLPEGREEGRALTRAEEERLQWPRGGRTAVVLFAVDDFNREAARFGSGVEEKLVKPMLELARQVPRVAARTTLQALYPSRYVMFYRVDGEKPYQDPLCSIARQVQSVWKDFMNISVSAGVCGACEAERAEESVELAERLLKLAVLEGKGAICAEWERQGLLDRLAACGERDGRMASALYAAEEVAFEEEKERFFREMEELSGIKEARERTLSFLTVLAQKFEEYEDDFGALFPEEINYSQKLSRYENVRELQLWLNNYFRWVFDYVHNKHDSRQADVILRAKRFISDNYANPELNLRSVADYVGLNEKYFSSRFTREAGVTFSNYLTEVRIGKAKQLMAQTDLKMYEVSGKVGYNNVEHFDRMFKKCCGVSPSDYRRREKGRI